MCQDCLKRSGFGLGTSCGQRTILYHGQIFPCLLLAILSVWHVIPQRKTKALVDQFTHDLPKH